MRTLAFALVAAVVAIGCVMAAPADFHAVALSVSPVHDIVAAGMIGAGLSFSNLHDTSALQPGMVFMAPLSIDDLKAKMQDLAAESAALVALADKEERDLTDDEIDKIEANRGEVEKITKQISARESAAAVPPGPGRRSTPEANNRGGNDDPAGARRSIPATPRDTARHGFSGFGEFALATRNHATGRVDNDSVRKLMGAATTYGNEGTGADGGFLVPPEFSRDLWQKVEAEETLMSRCAELTPSGNSMVIPKDEATPWGTSGVRVYWDGEAAAATASKAVFESSTLRLSKLTALLPASDELLEDAAGYESYIRAKVPGVMAHAINTAIVDGTGAGQPLGILRSPSVISVAKQTSQPADTVWMKNIEKMWARMYAPWRRNAIWLINQDVEPSLGGMAFQATGASSDLPGTSAVPAYLPPGGLSNSPYGTLKGRPVVPVQACKTIGDVGDIILVDLKQYWLLRKASGPKVDTSMHLYFDQSITAFRFIFRLAGQPAWSAAITPQNGSNTLSWAVTLDAR